MTIGFATSSTQFGAARDLRYQTFEGRDAARYSTVCNPRRRRRQLKQQQKRSRQAQRAQRRCATCSVPFSSWPRPDVGETEPAFLPQTIEYAVHQAQEATKRALCAGLTHVRVELPMGRSRSHWYVLSPVASWYAEASILAFHYAELFNGLHISLVLGAGPGVSHPVPWISELRRLEDDTPPAPLSSTRHVVIFAAVSDKQYPLLKQRLDEIGSPDAVILFCSFLNVPLSLPFEPFVICYLCRAFDKLAVMRDAYDAPWSIFIEIAVFEYEWVGDKPNSSKWVPLQETIERFAFANGACHKKGSKYLGTRFSGCEAGFWPFMTISCREVLPLDGALLEQEARKKEEKSKSRPFGFF